MYHRILVPLDGSATAERGLREAIALGGQQKATLRLLNVVDIYPMLAELSSAIGYEETLRGLRGYGEHQLVKAKSAAVDAGIPADTVLREVTGTRPADAIVEEAGAAGCDLIVMGTHGRRGFSRLTMGSTAELVVRTSPVPVLLVRLAEATS